MWSPASIPSEEERIERRAREYSRELGRMDDPETLALAREVARRWAHDLDMWGVLLAAARGEEVEPTYFDVGFAAGGLRGPWSRRRQDGRIEILEPVREDWGGYPGPARKSRVVAVVDPATGEVVEDATPRPGTGRGERREGNLEEWRHWAD